MPAATPPPVAHVAAATPLDRAIVRQVNNARLYFGRKPLIMTRNLHRVARHHTLDMLRRDSFSHNGDGTTFSARIRRRVHYRQLGENLAWFRGRRVSARRIVVAWLRSPGHRAVMLDRHYRRIGVGSAWGQLGPRSATVVTADFGTWR